LGEGKPAQRNENVKTKSCAVSERPAKIQKPLVGTREKEVNRRAGGEKEEKILYSWVSGNCEIE